MVCGKHPLAISLDDYFLDREKTPKDEEGNYDFESIEALDIDLVNDHLERLLGGEKVRLPRFNFVTGKREDGPERNLGPKGVLIIEGIHGLNDRLFQHIPRSSVFKIYVSPLTGISLDQHNRTSTTDNRLLRRLVRDYRLRAKAPEATLLQWPSVIRGAQEYIFPYQEGADEMFNSALVYELSVLKGYAEPLLRTIGETSCVYGDAQRLLGILRFIPFIPSDTVPNDSILREFIGGSGFDV
jgi:uridine kinase